jgi:hypothetical protein
MIDEEIRAALNVDPSPEFVARVRTRMATESSPSVWRWSWGLTIASALGACTVLVVIVSRPQTRPSTNVGRTSSAASESRPTSDGSAPRPGAAESGANASRTEQARAAEASALERDSPALRGDAPVRRSTVITRQGSAISRQARSLPNADASAVRTARSEPELLIDPLEARALRQLITGVRDGRVDLSAAQRSTAPLPMELEPVTAIVIAPITIEPIAPVPGAEGVRP